MVGSPNIVGTSTLPVNESPLPGCRPGPYPHGSDLWIIGVTSNGVGFVPSVTAFKSTDSGATYAPQVIGPATRFSGSTAFQNLFPAAVFPYYISGATVNIGYQDVSGELNVIAFDMAAEAFGSPNPSGAIVAPFNVGNMYFVIRPGGQQVFVYNEFNKKVFTIQFSGSWGPIVEVDDGSQLDWSLSSAVVDAAGNVGILYGKGGGLSGPVGNLLYSIFNGAAITSTVDTGYDAASGSRISQAPQFDSASDSVVFPRVRYAFTPTLTPTVSLLVGTPSAAPVFTTIDIAGYQSFEQLDAAGIVGNSAGNQFNVFYRVRPQTLGFDWCIFQSSATSLAGPWSTPTLYYDQNVNPTVPQALLLGINPLFVYLMAGGAIGVIGCFVIAIPTLQRGTMYSWAVAGPPPPPGTSLHLIKTVTPGGTAVPSDFTLSYAGPVSGSGAGGVGPVAVPAGAYTLTETGPGTYDAGPWVSSGDGVLAVNVLTLTAGQAGVVSINNAPHGTPPGPLTFAIISGALPPGLSLNTSTGVISGIPTAVGVYTYTAQVTDSDGNTATATCTITIGESAQFELRRIYATMKPHSRIPVRGS